MFNAGNELIHKLGDYMVSDTTLGQGTYAKVRLAAHIQNQNIYAMKIIKKPELEVKHYTRIKREVENLKGLRHPHIVQLHDVFQTKRFICIVMEYATGGDLYEYIQSQVSSTFLNFNITIYFLSFFSPGTDKSKISRTRIFKNI